MINDVTCFESAFANCAFVDFYVSEQEDIWDEAV